MQAVPAPRLLYRQLAFLLRDFGQPTHPVMGINGLSSTVYSLGARDRFLCWADRSKTIKQKGLNACMQVAVCMAVRPYSCLRTGRLAAAMALSDFVGSEFTKKFSRKRSVARLLGVVTTAATGIHAPIFNRIMLRKGGLYRRI